MNFAMLCKDSTKLITDKGSFYMTMNDTGTCTLHYLTEYGIKDDAICIYKDKESAQKALKRLAYTIGAFNLPYEEDVVQWL